MNLLARARVLHRTSCYLVAAICFGCLVDGREMPEDPDASAMIGENEATAHQSGWKRIVGPIDVGPIGWRRTTRGWERAEHWEVSVGASNAPQINQVIQNQKLQEQGTSLSWGVAMVLSFVRRIDPVTLISTQICLLALYIALVFHRRERRNRSGMGMDICRLK